MYTSNMIHNTISIGYLNAEMGAKTKLLFEHNVTQRAQENTISSSEPVRGKVDEKEGAMRRVSGRLLQDRPGQL